MDATAQLNQMLAQMPIQSENFFAIMLGGIAIITLIVAGMIGILMFVFGKRDILNFFTIAPKSEVFAVRFNRVGTGTVFQNAIAKAKSHGWKIANNLQILNSHDEGANWDGARAFYGVNATGDDFYGIINIETAEFEVVQNSNASIYNDVTYFVANGVKPRRECVRNGDILPFNSRRWYTSRVRENETPYGSAVIVH